MSEFYDTRKWSDPSEPLPLEQWPTRVRNALALSDIKTWGKLMSLTHAQLWGIPGLGPLSLKQVVTFIEEKKSR
jgi:DNA-directed RNA polymerase alpha subunit